MTFRIMLIPMILLWVGQLWLAHSRGLVLAPAPYLNSKLPHWPFVHRDDHPITFRLTYIGLWIGLVGMIAAAIFVPR